MRFPPLKINRFSIFRLLNLVKSLFLDESVLVWIRLVLHEVLSRASCHFRKLVAALRLLINLGLLVNQACVRVIIRACILLFTIF